MKNTRGRKKCLRPEAEEEDREVVSEEAQSGGSDLLKGNICLILFFLNHINIEETCKMSTD